MISLAKPGVRALVAPLALWGIFMALLAQAAPTVTLGTLAPDGTTYHRSLMELREQWRKAPGGGVNIRRKNVAGRGTGDYIKVGMTINIDSEEISCQQIGLFAKQGRLR